MTFRQILFSLRKSKLLLLLLTIFFVKQLFTVAVFPIFQGPDEPIHYSRVQQSANPVFRSSESNNKPSGSKFSEEINNTSAMTEAERISFDSFETQYFTNSQNGKSEDEIKNSNWNRLAENPYTTGNKFINYYSLNSSIEKMFSEQDIFSRFFAIRIFSAILGLLSVLFIFLSARKIFDEKISFLFSIIIAFQPMLSQTSAVVNYDVLLTLAFSIFAYGAVWALKEGPDWKNVSILILSTILGIATKAPGIVLALAICCLAVYSVKKRFKIRNNLFAIGTIIAILLAIIIVIVVLPSSYINSLLSVSENSHFNSVSQSILEYISETKNRWSWSELSYWGNFGWLDARIPSWIVDVAHYVEIAGILGIVAYFVFPKKIPEFLPRRKFVIFFIGIFLALEFAIRFADWPYYNRSGKIGLGTPGRYFLPVIGAQFALVAIGIGMLARKYSIWKNILKVLALSMIILWTYSMLIIIIPRYYL
ncbi:MAG: glycosyltransferase family 39 protein [Parcubacteria group bacterium]|jgi:hypothetical protein